MPPVDEVIQGDKVDLGKLATYLIGIPLYGLLSGVIEALSTFLGGIFGALEDSGEWVSGDVIGGITDSGTAALRIAWEQNSRFLVETFGPLAIFVAAAQMVVLVWLIRDITLWTVGSIEVI